LPARWSTPVDAEELDLRSVTRRTGGDLGEPHEPYRNGAASGQMRTTTGTLLGDVQTATTCTRVADVPQFAVRLGEEPSCAAEGVAGQ
jgi:hypothetical protein